MRALARPSECLRVRPALAILALVSVSACLSAPDPRPSAVSPQPSRGFASERAWADLNTLTGIGPRPMATEGAERARAYLRGELEQLGLEIAEQSFTVESTPSAGESEGLELRNLVAAIPGAASDVFLLAAPYDTSAHEDPRLGADDGASGAAVVLELARALVEDPLPYTVWVAFLEGEAERGRGEGSYFGSTALARRIRRLDALDAVRLAVVIDRVCDGDLRIARDRQSYRPYRDEFWRAAERLGHGAVFPRGAPYESPAAGHLSLSSGGLRQVVALVGSDLGSGPPPAPNAGAGDGGLPRCSPDGLARLGEVTLAALDRIAEGMAKIDRLAGAPPGGRAALRLAQLQAERARRSSSFNGTVRVVDLEGTRRLITGSGQKRLLQSSMDLEQPHRLVDDYTQIISVLTSLHPSPRRVLNIGLGGGVLPRFHLHRHAESRVKSVEIDPVVIELATEFFGVVDPRHTILEGDGAAVLRESADRFDVIWIDAYTAGEGVPDVFTEREFIDQLPTKLDSGGIVVANLWAKEPADFEGLVADYRRGFSHGVRVGIPGAFNDIVAVGDSSSLTCAAFRETLQSWSSRGLTDLRWTEDTPVAERCSDL